MIWYGHHHLAPLMEIKGARWYWPYHVTLWFACDVCHVYASCLLRTTVVNKMIHHNNFKKVFPLTVRYCESSLFRSTTWWSGVIDSNVRIQRVLTSLACTNMASEHKRSKGRTWVVWKIRSTWRCSPMMTSPSHVMIGHGLVDSDRVSLRWLEGCLSEWEFIK